MDQLRPGLIKFIRVIYDVGEPITFDVGIYLASGDSLQLTMNAGTPSDSPLKLVFVEPVFFVAPETVPVPETLEVVPVRRSVFAHLEF